MNYVEEVLKRKSFPDFIQALKWKVDTKEWTEVYGMYQIIHSVLEKTKFKPDFVFDIGCGKRPTLGVFLALNFKSFRNIVCVDPQLDTTCGRNIENIAFYNTHFENITNYFKDDNNFLILCNHSHVKKNVIGNFVKNKKFIYITSPCCVDNKFDFGEYVIDKNVKSSKNIYYISKNLGE